MTDPKGTGTIHWSGQRGALGTHGSIPIREYPSGEPLVGFPPEGVRIDKVLLRPLTLQALMAGLFFVDALTDRGRTAPELILPFVPGARQDRLNDAGDFLFTAKSVAREINARSFWRVTVFDPHSDVIAALIDQCHVVHAYECFEPLPMTGYAAVIAPDAGSEKRAGAVARKLGVPLRHGWKTRDVATGHITGFGLEKSEIAGPVLVVDDICDGGGTFIGLAEVLKEREIVADLYVTHGLFTQGTEKLLAHYQRLFCTDSTEGPREGVHVIPMCQQLIPGLP